MDNELHRFKEIPLAQFAAARGYQLVTGERTNAGTWRGSTASSVLMRHPATDDKIVIRRDDDGHWIYFSVRDSADHGTIVDFLQRRGQRNLGEVRQELRRWSGSFQIVASAAPASRVPEEIRRRKRADLLEAFRGLRQPDNNTYLNARGIRPETLRAERFRGTWLEDERGNAVFPHRDPTGANSVGGWEKKNNGFTGFSPNGEKTIWISRAKRGDTTLVIAESAIDALSYHQLHPDERTRYVSTGGAFGPKGEGLLRRVLARMPAGSTCVIATDRDRDGDKYATQITPLAVHRHVVRRDASPVGKDWNDCLKEHERQYIRSLSRHRAGR
jgi:hypothetical protein